MNRYHITLLAVLLAPTSVLAKGHPIKIGFYNVLNLFDVFDDPYTADEGTPIKSRNQIQLLAQVIQRLDADVLGLCEVENQHVLKAMVTEFLPEMGYEFIAVPESNSKRGIKLGLLSRCPIISITSYRWKKWQHKDAPHWWRFARDLMHARVQAKGQVIDVFVVHLKSKRGSKGDPKSVAWRTAEAAEARRIIEDLLAEDPNRLLALIGDFNSTPEEPATRSLLVPDESGQPVLVDLHAELPFAQRITRYGKKYPSEILDFILASPALAARHVSGSAEVFAPEPITQGSDHMAIAATFALNP